MKSDEVNGTSEVVPGERFGWHWKTSWRWGCHTGRLGAVRQKCASEIFGFYLFI